MPKTTAMVLPETPGITFAMPITIPIARVRKISMAQFYHKRRGMSRSYEKKLFFCLLWRIRRKKFYFFAHFAEFDEKNFIFLLTLPNLTKKIYFFVYFGEFDKKIICIVSLLPFSQKYTVQTLKSLNTGFAAIFLCGA